MENTNQSSNLKTVVAVLVLAVAGSGAYIYKMTVDSQNVQQQIADSTQKKSEVLLELVKLNETYNKAISENAEMSNELTAERDKVVQLMEELQKAKESSASLIFYKRRVVELEQRLKFLMDQVHDLQRENVVLKTQRDSSLTVLNQYKTDNNNIASKNEISDKTVSGPSGLNVSNLKQKKGINPKYKKGKGFDAKIDHETAPETIDAIKATKESIAERLSKIDITELKTESYKLKETDKPEETKTANKVDVIKISFVIPKNFVVRASERTYYIQVLDEKNQFVGENGSIVIDNQKIVYSFKTSVYYKNKALKVIENLYCKNFKKGTYTVKVYDKTDLVDQTTFVLK